MNTNDEHNSSKLVGPDELTELIDELDKIDETQPSAEENTTTISDNNSGRIELGEDPNGPRIIRK